MIRHLRHAALWLALLLIVIGIVLQPARANVDMQARRDAAKALAAASAGGAGVNPATLPAAGALTGAEVTAAVQAGTNVKVTPLQQSDFTLRTAIPALTAGTALTGGEVTNAVQGGVPVKITPAQIAAYSLGYTASLPAASALTGAELVPCTLGSVTSKCTASQQSAYTLGSAILALGAGTALTGGEVSNFVQGGVPVKITPAQIGAYVASVTLATNIAITGRDIQGRVSAYTSAGASYAVAYDAFGPSTITGAGKTVTVSRDAAGLVTSIVTN